MRVLVSLLVLVGIAMAGCNRQAPARAPGNASASDPAGHGGHGTPVARMTLLGNLVSINTHHDQQSRGAAVFRRRSDSLVRLQS